jgi:RNA polymerase sigma-70 factor (ECF subfamily)
MHDDDQERFTRLWTQAQPAIAGYVGALAPDAHAADDLLQDIAVALLRKFPDYDPQRPFIAWAMGIAKVQLLTLRRDRARAALRFRPETIESLAEIWQELMPEVDERRLALGECLKRVTGRGRELLTLRYEQALEPQEIAARLGLAAGAVRVALARVRTALHECIDRRLNEAGP